MTERTSRLLVLSLSGALCAAFLGCGLPPQPQSPIQATPSTSGRSLFGYHWQLSTADRRMEWLPQETAAAVARGSYVYVGSATGGELLGIVAATGRVRWRAKIDAIASAPVVRGELLYVGTGNGEVVCVDTLTGDVRWRFLSNGPISEPPVVADSLVIFANETDRVTALDALTGAFKWQYKNDTGSADSLLRGHAGLAADDQYVYTGFSNATVVALRIANGSVRWSSRLSVKDSKYVDIDSTPVLYGNRVYVASGAGGLFALDRNTGVAMWHRALGSKFSVGLAGLATDGQSLFVSAAGDGVFSLDMEGNLLWQHGVPSGGEPSAPTLLERYVLVSYAATGLVAFDKRSGELVEYFDPGGGISGAPSLGVGANLYVVSNRGTLFSLTLDE